MANIKESLFERKADCSHFFKYNQSEDASFPSSKDVKNIPLFGEEEVQFVIQYNHTKIVSEMVLRSNGF
jgi:hypothetical protein